MRRLSGLLLAGAIMMLPVFSQDYVRAAEQAAAPQKTTYTGDAVIQAVSVNADKVADYEAVMGKLKEALAKSARPEAKAQAAGWKVFKNAVPNPDGTLVYVHVINPVIKDADYSILNNAYEAVPAAEQRALYDTYRAALKAPLFVIQGALTSDFGK
jgi:hypothetical protein